MIKRKLDDGEIRKAVESSIMEIANCREVVRTQLDGRLSKHTRTDLARVDIWLKRVLELLALEQYEHHMSRRRASWLLGGALLTLNGAAADVLTLKHEFDKSAAVIERQCAIVDSVGATERNDHMGSSGIGTEFDGGTDDDDGYSHGEKKPERDESDPMHDGGPGDHAHVLRPDDETAGLGGVGSRTIGSGTIGS
jgi:hypothetical protein